MSLRPDSSKSMILTRVPSQRKFARLPSATDFDTDDFLSRFPLREAEFTRLTECRRLYALLWLIALSLVGPDDGRNPPDTPLRQAQRLRSLLESQQSALEAAD